MTFIRLAGCSIRKCHLRALCDERPWPTREHLTAKQIADRAAAHPVDIACVTGGEPTDHDLLPLLSALRGRGHRVHLETSGVRSVEGYPLDWLTVSPKLFDRPLAQRVGHTLKVVVHPDWSDAEAWERISLATAGTDFFHRYLQPTTVEGEPANLDQVARMLLAPENRNGWALSCQAHRAWGMP